MPKPVCCLEVTERLARHGMPRERIDRVTTEMADHWEDLYRAAVERGFQPFEAVIEANQRLGKADQLANNVIAGSRRSSWLGRHPILIICIAPFLLPLLLMAVVMAPCVWLDKWTHFSLWLVGDGTRLDGHLVAIAVSSLYGTTVIASFSWICWRAWKAGLGMRWISALCIWFGLAVTLRVITVDPIHRFVSLGIRVPPKLDIPQAVMLLAQALIIAGFFLAARRIRRKSSESIREACLP